MSDKKAVFFDADGTICDMEKGVPDSAVESIKKLIANGHQAWLCTGRSRAFISWYLEQIPFTGIISACGATIEKDGKRLYNNEKTPEIAKLSVEILRKYGLIPVMEGADYMYYDKDEYTTDVNWYTDLITESLGEKWRPIRGNENSMHINKISAKKQNGCNAQQASIMNLITLWEIRLKWFRKAVIKQSELLQSAGAFILHGKTRSYSETVTMICPCLNMQQQRWQWEMLPQRLKNWPIM